MKIFILILISVFLFLPVGFAEENIEKKIKVNSQSNNKKAILLGQKKIKRPFRAKWPQSIGRKNPKAIYKGLPDKEIFDFGVNLIDKLQNMNRQTGKLCNLYAMSSSKDKKKYAEMRKQLTESIEKAERLQDKLFRYIEKEDFLPMGSKDIESVNQHFFKLKEQLDKNKKHIPHLIEKFYKDVEVKKPDERFLRNLSVVSLVIEHFSKIKNPDTTYPLVFWLRCLIAIEGKNLPYFRYTALCLDNNTVLKEYFIYYILGLFLKDTGSENFFMECTKLDSLKLKILALKALARIKSQKMFPQIKKLFDDIISEKIKDKKNYINLLIVIARLLGNIHNIESVSLLEKILNYPGMRSKIIILRALAKIGSPEAAKILLRHGEYSLMIDYKHKDKLVIDQIYKILGTGKDKEKFDILFRFKFCIKEWLNVLEIDRLKALSQKEKTDFVKQAYKDLFDRIKN